MRKKRVIIGKRTFWIRFRKLFSRWKRKHKRKKYPNLEEIYEEDPSFKKAKLKQSNFLTFDELQQGLNKPVKKNGKKRVVKREVVRKRVLKKKIVTKTHRKHSRKKKKIVRKNPKKKVSKRKKSKK